MNYTFLDNGVVLQIKTNCARYSQSKDEKTFTFCQKGRCCSTGGLLAQNQRCKQNIELASELGECSKSHFDFENVQGNVTWHDEASATEVWTPEWVKLVLRNGSVIKCSFDGSLEDKPSIFFKVMHFLCKPEGNVFLFYVYKNFDNYAFG